jgi:hypothetical protein
MHSAPENTHQARTISVDLFQSARRRESFAHWTDEKLHFEIDRYERFLLLAARHPGASVAPTRDIDEIWHLHMQHPRAYVEDCQRQFGDIFDHDGGFGTAPDELPLLKEAFARTEALWLAEYGQPYVKPEDHPNATNCWHDCANRCWHACSSKS